MCSTEVPDLGQIEKTNIEKMDVHSISKKESKTQIQKTIFTLSAMFDL